MPARGLGVLSQSALVDLVFMPGAFWADVLGGCLAPLSLWRQRSGGSASGARHLLVGGQRSGYVDCSVLAVSSPPTSLPAGGGHPLAADRPRSHTPPFRKTLP